MTVEFHCMNCGKPKESEILGNQHSVLGEINRLNKEETCCPRPDYVDEKGFRRARKEQELTEHVPGL